MNYSRLKSRASRAWLTKRFKYWASLPGFSCFMCLMPAFWAGLTLALCTRTSGHSLRFRSAGLCGSSPRLPRFPEVPMLCVRVAGVCVWLMVTGLCLLLTGSAIGTIVTASVCLCGDSHPSFPQQPNPLLQDVVLGVYVTVVQFPAFGTLPYPLPGL